MHVFYTYTYILYSTTVFIEKGTQDAHECLVCELVFICLRVLILFSLVID